MAERKGQYPEYSFESGQRYCIFFCNEFSGQSKERKGVDDEIKKINKIFKDRLGFHIVYKNDKSLKETKKILENISEEYKEEMKCVENEMEMIEEKMAENNSMEEKLNGIKKRVKEMESGKTGVRKIIADEIKEMQKVKEENEKEENKKKGIIEEMEKDNKDRPLSCFVLIFSSHGSEGMIQASDGQSVTYKEINDYLNIPLLKDVPKVLYLSACRNKIKGVNKCDLFQSFDIPDMLVMLGVPSGDSGKRTDYTGSRFLNSVYEIYSKNEDIDVMSLAVDINDHLYIYKQQNDVEQKAVCFSTLKKRLIIKKKEQSEK
ncbi:XP_029644994.1caspase-14-like [Octopus vulgaris]|uniref:XP_029644994.1caspase-14-like n=1 Tax=Octopus vulgaris TaxID=6645 RepID=A0AA36FD74_OCTVU|nr:XP_029644994.1caspase-14-like [Octopus vulgaris]